MRSFLAVSFVINSLLGYSQQEATNWVIDPNLLLHFNGGQYPVLLNGGGCLVVEANASISDENGLYLFCTNGDTIKGANNTIFPGGDDISPLSSANVLSGTQGAMIIKKPLSAANYYIFSLGREVNYNGILSYSEVIADSITGNGSILTTQNILIADTLSEKLTATKHCNQRDIWVVVIKYTVLTYSHGSVGLPIDYMIEFNSFLVTANGVQSSPVKSMISTTCPMFGQMKFNNAGNELAFASDGYLTRFSFDKSTGVVELLEKVVLPLENGYGLEYSPDDHMIYINEKQWSINSGSLTALKNYNLLGPLQRGPDGRIYLYIVPEDEVTVGGDDSMLNANCGDFNLNIDNTSYIGTINFPNTIGTGAGLSDSVVSIYRPGNQNQLFTFPNFPSYYFNHSISDFEFDGHCVDQNISFFLSHNATYDSINWDFGEASMISADTANYLFNAAGEYSVSCTVYHNGTATTSTQCITICGSGISDLPNELVLCENASVYVNGLTTCGEAYNWNTGDSTSGIWIDDIGTYILKTTNLCGVFYDTVEVISDNSCTAEFEIPNVFTPNNDQINDDFEIDVKNVASFTVTFLNRWGTPVHDLSVHVPSKQIAQWSSYSVWDGTNYSGDLVNDGTFFYVIEYRANSKSGLRKTGFVQVIK